MACLVSLCSFTDFTTRKTLIKDLQVQRKHNCRVQFSSSSYSTGMHLAPKLCRKELVSIELCGNPADAVFLDYKDVCTPSVISGFWVGPDIEDGWGFVEATVNQIFEV